jgi:hypothetical protein
MNQPRKRRGAALAMAIVGMVTGFFGGPKHGQTTPVEGGSARINPTRRPETPLDDPPYGGHGEEAASGGKGEDATEDETLLERTKDSAVEAYAGAALEPGHPVEDEKKPTPTDVTEGNSPPDPPDDL